MRISKAIKNNRDLPQLECISLAAASAGSGSDFEHVIVALPTLRQNAPAGTAGMQPDNTMSLRWVSMVFEAAITGANTNNATFSINQRRGGSLLINTTSSTVVTAGSVQTITVASMNNIFINSSVLISGGTGTAETVVVQNINYGAGTFTAFFANAHSGTYNVTSSPLATITFASGTNAAQWVPIQLVATPLNVIKPGDVLTCQRTSAGTGLATPAACIILEWASAGVY